MGFFDFDDGDYCNRISDNMAIDSDGDIMMRLSDNLSMDMESGETHFTSSWNKDDNN